MAATTRIEAYRIGELPEKVLVNEHQGYRTPLEDYPMASGPIEIPPGEAARLKALLLSPSSFHWDGPVITETKACIFEPGIRLDCLGPQSRVQLLFCFTCADIVAYRDGKPVGGPDFRPSRRSFAAIMKRLFPNDAAIQGL